MSRTIKIKAWSTRDKKMCKPFEIEWFKYNVGPEDWKNGFVEGWWFNEDDIFLEWTGLLDRNGKEIYEGDIINWEQGAGSKGTSEVVFSYGCFEENEKGNKFGFKIGDINSEIIGNIYENPELIK